LIEVFEMGSMFDEVVENCDEIVSKMPALIVISDEAASRIRDWTHSSTSFRSKTLMYFFTVSTNFG